MNEYWNKELPKRDKGKGRGERGREKEMTKLLEFTIKTPKHPQFPLQTKIIHKMTTHTYASGPHRGVWL